MLRFSNIDRTPTRLPPVYGYLNSPLLSLRDALDPLIAQIDKLDQYINTANQKCHFPSEHGLTREESASIYIYTMDWGEQSLYGLLNKLLREKDRSKLIPWHGYLKLFDTALKKLPNMQCNLWRSIKKIDINENYKENQEITWWAFTSCSPTVKVVEKFLGDVSTLMMIEAKSGKDITKYSRFPEENEVILTAGTRVRLVSDPLDLGILNVKHFREITEVSNGIVHPSVLPNIDPEKMKVITYNNGDKYDITIHILRATDMS